MEGKFFRLRPAYRLKHVILRWHADRRGAYAPIFGILLIPMLIAIGAAVDLSQAYVVKQRMTKALDAAGLAVAGMTGLTTAQMQTTAQSYFNANYPTTELGVPGAVTVTTSGNIVSLTANGSMPTAVMGVVGVSTMNIKATSQITKMGKKIEVALVLDTTGSMDSSSKMTTMQTAAKNLITTVSAAAVTAGDVKVAIVPFTVDVNVGTTYKNETWIKWSWTSPKTQSCTGNGSKKVCVDATTTVSKSSWKGCVGDRDMNYDVSVSLPSTSNAATLYPADNADCYSESLMPLSYDWTALKAKIDNLKPNGNTNTTIGLMWGWNMLTQGATLSAAAAIDTKKLDKVLVFLTDGDNTENRFTTNGDTIDGRTEAICTAIKATGIIVYTIRVMNGNASLLQGCATDTTKYYSVTTASQLTTVFNSIAQALSNLRVSQ